MKKEVIKEAKPLLLNLSTWQNRELKRMAKESGQTVVSFVCQKIFGERNVQDMFTAQKEQKEKDFAIEVLGYIAAYKDLGLRTAEIAKKLNDKGVRTKSGKEFTEVYVRKLWQLSKLRANVETENI